MAALKKVNIDYKLPSAIEYLHEGWLASVQSAAVVSALFAASAVQLLGFMKDPNNFPKDSQNVQPSFLVMLSYCAVLFNFSATITSLILIDKLGELRLRASRNPDLQQGQQEEDGAPPNRQPRRIAEASLKLLERFGAGESWRWMMWHWLFFLLAGILCAIAQILAYIWLVEPLWIRVLMTIFTVLSLIPLFSFVCRPDRP